MLTGHERKTLTELIGEKWIPIIPNKYRNDGLTEDKNRTFTTIADLHAVYQAIYERGEWDEFMDFFDRTPNGGYSHGCFAWLMCLSGGIEERMRMVVEWIGGNNAEV